MVKFGNRLVDALIDPVWAPHYVPYAELKARIIDETTEKDKNSKGASS